MQTKKQNSCLIDKNISSLSKLLRQKTIISFIIILTSIYPTSFAQNSKPKEFFLNFKGGVNFSAFTKEHTEFNTLFAVGVAGDYYVYKNFGVSFEIDYTQRGGILRQILPKPNNINPYVDTFYEIDLYAQNNYLDFPLLFKYKIFLSNNLIIVPTVGISYSIPLPFQESSQIKNKKIVESSTLPEFTGQYSDDKALLNSLLGINLGASLVINKFIVELRYFRSLNEIEGAKNIEKLKFEVHSLQIFVGYSI